MTHFADHSQMENHRVEYGDTFLCARCNQVKPVFSNPESTLAPEFGYGGYGLNCWVCCGAMDLEYMKTHDRMDLYFTNGMISNWPGTIKTRAYDIRKGVHNIAGSQTTGRFTIDGQEWSFRQYGSFCEIARCRKIKRGAK